jgi:hypothetical protein
MIVIVGIVEVVAGIRPIWIPAGINGRIVGATDKRIIVIPSVVSPVPRVVVGESQANCWIVVVEAVAITRHFGVLVIVAVVITVRVRLFVVVTGCVLIGGIIVIRALVACRGQLCIASSKPEERSEKQAGEQNPV